MGPKLRSIQALSSQMTREKSLFFRITREKEQEFEAYIEKKYPRSILKLQKISQDLVQGAFGNAAKERARSLDETLLSFPSIFLLLVLDFLDRGVPPLSEWIERLIQDREAFQEICLYWKKLKVPPRWEELLFFKQRCFFYEAILLKKIARFEEKNLSLSPIEKHYFSKYFRLFLENRIFPGHLSVEEKWEETEDADLCLDEALSLEKKEKERALQLLVGTLLKNHQVDRALLTLGRLQSKQSKVPIEKLISQVFLSKTKEIETLAESRELETALNLIDKEPKEEKDTLYKRLALTLMRLGSYREAYLALMSIESGEVYQETESFFVPILLDKGLLNEAKAIVGSLKEPGYREDAFSEILAFYLDSGLPHEAALWLEKAASPDEQRRLQHKFPQITIKPN